MSKDDVTLDHIVPKSKGGTEEWNNYQAVHAHCNRRKGNLFMDELKNRFKNRVTPELTGGE